MISIAQSGVRKVIGPNKKNSMVPAAPPPPWWKSTATKTDPSIALGAANKAILKGQGLDLDTVLASPEKRKKRAGLRGEVETIGTVLGG